MTSKRAAGQKTSRKARGASSPRATAKASARASSKSAKVKRGTAARVQANGKSKAKVAPVKAAVAPKAPKTKAKAAANGHAKPNGSNGAAVEKADSRPALQPARVAPPSKRRERKEIAMLVERGHQKGFLTYDEINDTLPPEMVTADQLDELMVLLADEKIELVDAQAAHARKKVAPPTSTISVRAKKTTVPPPAFAMERPSMPPTSLPPSAEEGFTKSTDPVRLYLRKMGSVSLLTREGEVEIARRIEEGEDRIFEVILNSRVGVAEIIDIGESLRKGKIRIKDVTKDADTEDQEFDEEAAKNRVIRLIDKVKKLEGTSAKIRETLEQDKRLSEKARKVELAGLEKNRRELIGALREVRLTKKQIEKVVSRIKEYIRRVNRAENSSEDAARRAAGMNVSDIRKTIREMQASEEV
ncbi:MAG: hypothetical protein KC417_04390, partial [Myxococcales bacterium]|nr:hypothetical protein [Myxococcales bacterium]